MAGKTTQGTTVSRESALGSDTFVVIANVKSFDGPSGENPEIDTTDLGSPAKEFEGGLKDWGELTLELNFDHDNTTHEQAIADFEANPPTKTGWRITFVNPTKNYTWPAFVKSFKISGAVDGVYSASMTLRLAGARTVS